MRRVAITGLGMITPIGLKASAVWESLLSLKSGLKHTSTLPNGNEYKDVPSRVVAPVPEEFDQLLLEDFSAGEVRRYARFTQYAMLATKDALQDSQIDVENLSAEERDMIGICMGSGIGGWEETMSNTAAWYKEGRRSGYKGLGPMFIPKMLGNMASGNVSIKYGLRGPNHTVSTACASGVHAIGDAFRFIQGGYADVMVAGASEASVHPIALGGFARAKSVYTGDEIEGASRPFDGERGGFVLGEGCGVLILEELERARSRGAKIYAEVLGYGLSGDAYHITSPSEDGSGALRSMQMALKMAGKTADQVGYVNAHATSTPIGDRIENRAIWKLVGQKGIDRGVMVGACKGHFGHLLGAAGAVETAIGALCVSKGVVAPTKNCSNVGGLAGDDENNNWGFDYVGDVEGGRAWNRVDEEVALCNSFGFGGTNATICLGRLQD